MRGEDTSVKQQAIERLNRLIRVRRVNDLKGDSPDAVVARAKLMLDHGDVKGALVELQKLDSAQQSVAQPWMNEAQKYVAAREGSNSLTETLLKRASQGSGTSLEGVMSLIDGNNGAATYVSPALLQHNQNHHMSLQPQAPTAFPAQ